MNVILYLEKQAKRFIENGKSLNLLIESGLFDKVIKMKYDVPNSQIELLDGYEQIIDETIKNIH